MYPTDQEQRTKALDVAQSFIIQAPAGSGKTELLIQRYLKLLAQCQQPEEIVAITFTVKAAAEMRTRVLDALQQVENLNPVLPEKLTLQLAHAALLQNNRLGWNLLENPHRLSIQTIDGLCNRLTRQMLILSRFGAQPDIASNIQELYVQASREVLGDLERNKLWTDSLIQLLLHLDNDHAKVIDLFCNMLAKRDQWLSSVLTAKNQRQALEEGLQQTIKETQIKLSSKIPKHLQQEIIELLQFSAQQWVSENTDNVINHWKTQNQWPSAHHKEQQKWLCIADLLLTKDNHWRKKVDKSNGFPAPSEAKSAENKLLYKTMKERVMSLIQQLESIEDIHEHLLNIRHLPNASYSDNQWNILNCLLKLLPVLVAYLYVIFQEKNVVDYIEVTQCALEALGGIDSPTDLALTLDYRIQHILLDEFQDTSIIQLKLLEHLIAGWQSGDGRTLFLVGDPMQSIYRFRKAEVGLFLRVKYFGIGAITLQSLTLTNNFRSTKNIITWINQVFSNLMPAKEDASIGAVSFNPSLAYKSSENDSNIYCYASINNPENASHEISVLVEAIKNLRKNNDGSSIAILVRARAHLTEILPALQQANIPYRAIEIENLKDKPLIYDLLALTRALLHPGDRIAWLAILRAPWCGLTLSELHMLANNNQDSLLWTCLQKFNDLPLREETKSRLSMIVSVLAASMRNRQRQTLARNVEGTWMALGGPACLNNANELMDAKAFFKLLEKLTSNGNIINLAKLEEQLAELYAKPDNSSSNCISVMTIHKAKGLEFDHVFLPGLEREISSDKAQLLLHMERINSEGKMDLLLAPIKAITDTSDSIYEFLAWQEKKRADYELIRLFYVAATRAKKTLHLFAKLAITHNDNNEIKKPSGNSLLAKIWPIIENDFIKNMPQTNDIELKNVSIATMQPLRRLTSHWQLPPTPQGIKPHFEWVASAVTHKNRPSMQKNDIPSHIGIVIHRLLQQICLDGIQHWQNINLDSKQAYLHHQLLSLGVPPSELTSAFSIIKQALQNTLDDPRGRWILDNQHQDSKTEYALTTIIEEQTVSIIIDRTFIDQNNTRWIIDYKTGSDPNNNYRPQLEQYAKIIQMLDARPIRLGLYFPLQKTWQEWSYQEN